MPPKLIAYYRVSTRQQGESGLGLEGQVAAVESYAQSCAAAIVRSYQEIETGKRADRPELLKAIADALNAEGHTTRRGKPWSQVQVKRVLGRVAP
jgi:DNA invertase Pin-like site-specific DNA recombinase